MPVANNNNDNNRCFVQPLVSGGDRRSRAPAGVVSRSSSTDNVLRSFLYIVLPGYLLVVTEVIAEVLH